MIKYLGSKRKLIQHILAAAEALPGPRTLHDPFSGTARVGSAFKAAGWTVTASDLLHFPYLLAQTYVELDRAKVLTDATAFIAALSDAPSLEGYVTKTFCTDARFFTPINGARIDGIRKAISEAKVSDAVRKVALVSLIEAADRVDSTTGVQMAYLKQWATRAHNPLTLRLPELLDGVGTAILGPAEDLVADVNVNVTYLDPPYNQHSYLGNYHIWETLARGDEPEAYGIAQKRIDCKERRSRFNSKRQIHEAMSEVVARCRSPHMIVSFNNEGYLDADELTAMLEKRGHVGLARIPYDRYVGAKIGIHNLKGERVGQVSHTRNEELLFVCSPNQAHVDEALHAIARVAEKRSPSATQEIVR